ncbi:MAG: hypothetical protein IIA72_01315 [Proteobacteria bacterium]|nr:hypothetical protein [Pseudomonadota bacterium]
MKTFRLGQSATFEMDAHWRIESVARTLEYLEDFLPHAKDQAFLRKRQELTSCKKRYEREEVEAELELMELEWNGRFPAYFYGSLLVLLWGEIEAVIERFAAEIQSIKSVSLAFNDIRGRHAYNRLRKYVQAILGVSVPENSTIEDLQFLRNLYAHHGGDIGSQSNARMKRIHEILRTYPGVSQSDTFIVVNAKYLEEAMDNVVSLIKALRDVHPSTEPGLVEIDRR